MESRVFPVVGVSLWLVLSPTTFFPVFGVITDHFFPAIGAINDQ